MLFTVTEEMHTWAVKPIQHCRGGEGRGRGRRICSFWARWLHGAKLKTALKCLNTFVRRCRLFCGGSEKSRFQWLHKEQFQNFLEQVKLFPNFTSTPFDYLLISWVTNYAHNRGFLTCFLYRELHALKSLHFGLLLSLHNFEFF